MDNPAILPLYSLVPLWGTILPVSNRELHLSITYAENVYYVSDFPLSEGQLGTEFLAALKDLGKERMSQGNHY